MPEPAPLQKATGVHKKLACPCLLVDGVWGSGLDHLHPLQILTVQGSPGDSGTLLLGAEPLVLQGQGAGAEADLCQALALGGQRGRVPTTHVCWTNALASPAWAESMPLPLSRPIREAIGKKTFSHLDRSKTAEWLVLL